MSSLSIKRKISVVMIISVFAAAVLLALNPAKSSAGSYRPDNTGRHNYWISRNWSECSYSYLVTTSDGGYMIFEGNKLGEDYYVEYYDSSFILQSTGSVPVELPLFGAFYTDGAYYYLLTGGKNPDKLPDVECYRLTKYDKSWNRIASCGVYDCDTCYPFEAGGASITSSGKYVVARSCHAKYSGHQSNFTFMVDSTSMELLQGNPPMGGYVSHSFNQYVKIDNNHVVSADHGDAYPRAIVVYSYYTDINEDKFCYGYPFSIEYDVLPISGEIGDNTTGATLGGFEVTGSSYIVAGTSIEQGGNSSVKNVYFGIVNKSSGAISLNWLTDYQEDAGNPFIVKINDSRLAVIWSKDSKVYYAFIDGSGNLTGSISSANGYLSDCQPVLKDGRILWYVYNGTNVVFYSIDASSGAFMTQTGTTPTPTPGPTSTPRPTATPKPTSGPRPTFGPRPTTTPGATATPKPTANPTSNPSATPTPSVNYKNEWVQMGGNWYYFDNNGKIVTGWYKVGAWYYFDESGVMQTGWQLIDGKWYYLRPSGSMFTGWLPWGNSYYYLDNSGAMVTGWKKIDGTWYYFLDSGAMVKGWKLIGGTWYYFESDGAMHVGWLLSGSAWYYFDTSGAMVTGWKSTGGYWYYFDSDGTMQTGWLNDAGKWYYLDTNGRMVTGTVKIDGKEYTFDSSGVCTDK